MDEAHLMAAARYVSLNPVRAGLVRRPEDWPWSSVRAHLERKDDVLVMVTPLLERYGDFKALLDRPSEIDDAGWAALRKSESTGRPVGSERWLAELEQRTGRRLRPGKRGPKKSRDDSEFSKLSP